MRLDLYTIGYPEPLPPEQFRLLLELLPLSLQKKPGRYRRWQDAHANLLGKLLLRTALRRAGHPVDLTRLVYSDWQKPSLPDAPHFNISHSGHRVVCLLSDSGAVGIDIEALAPFSFDDLHPQFTENEWTVIRHSSSPLAAFYHFWTAKESIIKADGRGLGIPLQDIDLSTCSTILLEGRRWSVYEAPLFEGYACCYAIEKKTDTIGQGTEPPAVVLHELTTADLM